MTRKDTAEFVITPGLRDEDQGFFYNTWYQSYKWSRSMPDSAYYSWQRRRVEGILARNPLILFARDSNQDLYLYGYGVFERDQDNFIAHWCYVKKEERYQGVASELLRAALDKLGRGASTLYYTHKTKVSPKVEEMGFKYLKLEELVRTQPFVDKRRYRETY